MVSPRSATFMMVDNIAATDLHTVVIHLKFATSAFLPALADPYNWIYQKKISTRTPTGTSTTSWVLARSSSRNSKRVS